jgi:hypothetical protein
MLVSQYNKMHAQYNAMQGAKNSLYQALDMAKYYKEHGYGDERPSVPGGVIGFTEGVAGEKAISYTGAKFLGRHCAKWLSGPVALIADFIAETVGPQLVYELTKNANTPSTPTDPDEWIKKINDMIKNLDDRMNKLSNSMNALGNQIDDLSAELRPWGDDIHRLSLEGISLKREYSNKCWGRPEGRP